jgi:hypothetical protein
MLKKNKTTSAPLGIAFLFLTLTSVPVSLRVVGFDVSLNRGSVAGAWGQVAGIFVSGYQPVSAMEWVALSLLDTKELNGVESAPADQPCLATACEPESQDQLEPDPVASDSAEPESGLARAETISEAKQHRRCPKQLSRPASAAKRVELAVVRDKLLPRSLLQIETHNPAHMIKLASYSQDWILKDVEQQISQYKFDMIKARAALRVVPNRINLIFNPDSGSRPEVELQRVRLLRQRVENERRLRCLPAPEAQPVTLDTG